MYDSTISLLTMSIESNDIGDSIETVDSSHTVFCRVASADVKEKQLAESRGKNANIVFILADMRLYHDERWLTYKGSRYEVVDTKFGDTSNEIRLVGMLWQGQ